MTLKQLDRILDAAEKEVKSWPKWMQKKENRQKEPHNNSARKEGKKMKKFLKLDRKEKSVEVVFAEAEWIIDRPGACFWP